ncbi:MAG TPA: histidine phosphatase family protein [Trinickia sp.]|uniref:histidine phosphatase family protein n=1 Tax=Trinickia sp. TaxID=2571163 RepID=UPI002CDFFD1C|nr:histidine phosphatase family protein [Trinickia sp.]HTI17195.1 histidine phosphatase family protein [Trinickia sp.]
MATRILFIRHGETPWNRVKRFQGHLDIPLAESGVIQARRLAERLARKANSAHAAKAMHVEQGRMTLEAIYSSDLQRAQETARPTATALGLPLALREGLRERHYGVFQGHDNSELAARFPEEFKVWETRRPDFAPEGGESSRAFSQRVLDTVASIVAAHPGGYVACVTHGGVLDCVYRHARGLALDAPRDYPLFNASINTVDFDEELRASVVAWADVEHLQGESDDDTLAHRGAASR